MNVAERFAKIEHLISGLRANEMARFAEGDWHRGSSFAQADKAKRILAAYLADCEAMNRKPTKGMHSATGLRTMLERFISGYFSEDMLAVSLAEMGYSVRYYDRWHFKSNFPHTRRLTTFLQGHRGGLKVRYARSEQAKNIPLTVRELGG